MTRSGRTHVLLVSHEATRTGAPRIAVEIARVLTERGDRVTTLLRWDGPLRRELATASTSLRVEPFRRLRAMARTLRPRARFTSRLEEAIAALTLHWIRPDLVYANTVKSACYVRPALRLGIPVVLHVHELEPLASSTLARYDLDDCYAKIHLVACSAAVAANLAAVSGVELGHIALVPSMVDAERVRALAEDRLTVPRRAPGTLVVGACGTADHRKGVDLWVEAASRVGAALPGVDVRFVWVGAQEDNGAAVAATTGPHVAFVGEVADPYPWLASFDVFTMPSRVDPFPLAVLEAMTLARPVVAFDIPGIRDQVGDAGVLVAAQDVDAFANAIVDLLGSAELRVRLGTAARAHVDAQCGFDRFAALVRDQVATATRTSASEAAAPPARLRYEPVGETGTEVTLLHAFDDRALIASAEGAPLPYRVEQLTENGIALALSARERRRPWNRALVRRIVRFLERLGVPFLQVALASRDIAASDTTIAMFESQGNAMAVLRALHIRPFTKPRLVVVACWLANELERAGRFRRGLYRWAYRSVDDVIYFSSNQGDVYANRLGMAAGRLHSLPFGVDTEYFRPDPTIPESDYVVAVGRDGGRDWATLLASVRGTDLRVRVACRANALDGLDIPSNVEMVGFIDREQYRELLAGARIVAVVTKVLPYPTGQSVLLEAMAMGKACVVTDAPALSEYTRDEIDTVLVPPGDSEALRAALSRLNGDASLRDRLGSVAHATVTERFGTARMWTIVANVLRGSGGDRP